MGAYLSQPITDKESTDGEDAKLKYGTTAMQGWRTNMEVRARNPRHGAATPGAKSSHPRALRARSNPPPATSLPLIRTPD